MSVPNRAAHHGQLAGDVNQAADLHRRHIDGQGFGGFREGEADFKQFGVAPQAFHVVFAHVAVAAQRLDRPIRDVLGHGRAVELHAV